MPWCVKASVDGVLGYWTARKTRAEAISSFCGYARMDWPRARRVLHARTLRVRYVPEEPSTDARLLAFAVLEGDTDAALVLADLVLETYHAAAKQGG